MNEPKNLKPFNLERALAGDPVVTKSGLRVEQMAHFKDAGDANRVIVKFIGDGRIYKFTNYGEYSEENSPHNEYDLFMAPKQREAWVNLYPPIPGEICVTATVHTSEEMANHIYDQVIERLGYSVSDRIGGKAHKIIIEE